MHLVKSLHFLGITREIFQSNICFLDRHIKSLWFENTDFISEDVTLRSDTNKMWQLCM